MVVCVWCGVCVSMLCSCLCMCVYGGVCSMCVVWYMYMVCVYGV